MTGCRRPLSFFRPALVAAALLPGACAQAPEPGPKAMRQAGFALDRVTYADLPGWSKGKQAGAIVPLTRSCEKLSTQPADRPVGKGSIAGLAGRIADWRAACAALRRLRPDDDKAAKVFFERQFTPFRVRAGTAEKGVFTGYYEAEIRASRVRRGPYTVPIYGPPPDLTARKLGRISASLAGQRVSGRIENGRLVPYFSRAEIEAGPVAKNWPVLLWTDDPVDLFVTHVQGSAIVRLDDGATTRIGYAADNGMTFVAIGRLMLERKIIAPSDASMQGIRAWLKANPGRAQLLMRENPRYIFFREIDGAGPVGAQGVPLSPGRSLAVDPRYIPFGAPLWLVTSWPGRADRPLRRLMVAQDRGNAIKGAVRGDFFWGSGEAALEQAGRMKQRGEYYLLLPRAVADRLAAAKAKTGG